MERKKNTEREAAALQYNKDHGRAPVITALGRGYVADRIVEAARHNNVPVMSDALLAQALNKLSVGDEIPREFYAIVAQILVMVSKMDREYPGGAEPDKSPEQDHFR